MCLGSCYRERDLVYNSIVRVGTVAPYAPPPPGGGGFVLSFHKASTPFPPRGGGWGAALFKLTRWRAAESCSAELRPLAAFVGMTRCINSTRQHACASSPRKRIWSWYCCTLRLWRRYTYGVGACVASVMVVFCESTTTASPLACVPPAKQDVLASSRHMGRCWPEYQRLKICISQSSIRHFVVSSFGTMLDTICSGVNPCGGCGRRKQQTAAVTTSCYPYHGLGMIVPPLYPCTPVIGSAIDPPFLT